MTLKWLIGIPHFLGTMVSWRYITSMDMKGKFWPSSQNWGQLMELPWGHMDVLEEASKPVHQRHTQWTQEGVPVGLHVLRGTPLGITLTAKIIRAWCHDVWDEIIISTGCLKKKKQKCFTKQAMQKHSCGFGQVEPCWDRKGENAWRWTTTCTVWLWIYQTQTGNHSI